MRERHIKKVKGFGPGAEISVNFGAARRRQKAGRGLWTVAVEKQAGLVEKFRTAEMNPADRARLGRTILSRAKDLLEGARQFAYAANLEIKAAEARGVPAKKLASLKERQKEASAQIDRYESEIAEVKAKLAELEPKN